MRSLVLVILLLIPFHTYSQITGQVSAQINITTEAIQTIELITVKSMNIGNSQPDQEIININPINDDNAGFMIAVGTPGAEFRLDYFTERRLTQVGGTGFLTFRYFISGSIIEEQINSELLDIENRNLRFNNDGRYYFWVGGEVSLQNAKPGNYEGDFTIEIDYI